MKADNIVAILNSRTCQYIVGTICLLVITNKAITVFQHMVAERMPAPDKVAGEQMPRIA